MIWIGEHSFPDSAYDQEVVFDGCLAVFNIPPDPHFKYREQLTEAIGNAYASNYLVFFLYDNDKPIEPPAEWVDLLEFGYAISPLQAICQGMGKSELSFLPEERQVTLGQIAENVFKFNRLKFVGKGRRFRAIGSVTISGKDVLMPLTEVNLSNGKS